MSTLIHEKAGEIAHRVAELKHVLGVIADCTSFTDDAGRGTALLSAAERLAGALETEAWALSDELGPQLAAPGSAGEPVRAYGEDPRQ